METLKRIRLVFSLIVIISSFFACSQDAFMSDIQQILTSKDSTKTSSDTTSSATTTTTTTPKDTTTTTTVTTPKSTTTDLSANFYVSPQGDDNNPGTYDKPLRTIEKAYSVASAGDLVYFRGGKYQPQNPGQQLPMNLNAGRNGSDGKLIKFWAYPGETPIIDLSGITYTGGAIRAVYFTGNYWHWKGFEVTGLVSTPTTGVFIAFLARDVNNSIFENFNIHHNSGIGFAMTGSCSNNLILNSDSHHNADGNTTTDPYGNADGFQVGYNTGTNNTLRGCRAWVNSDDGFDDFQATGSFTFENCWSFWNGFKPGTENSTWVHAGDGNGWKLSGTTTFKNCIAFQNYLFGWNHNGSGNLSYIYNCVGYQNGFLGKSTSTSDYIWNFKMNNGSQHVVYSSISYGESNNKVYFTGTMSKNNFGSNGELSSASVTTTDADFASLNPSGVDGARQSDGSLPVITFLHLSSGSDLKGAGVDGTNIGAF